MQDVTARKTVTIVIPTYNEEENIALVHQRVTRVFEEELKNRYVLEILFIDNHSQDSSRSIIEGLAHEDGRVKAIFNARNFGYTQSSYYGLSQAQGDCAILLNADMQEPPELIPRFIAAWEAGSKIVVGVKNKSRENPLLYRMRQTYYFFIRKISEIDHIDQFFGFGLYDRSFIKVLRELNDPVPYLRGIVAELGFQIERIEYTQERREHGKSTSGFYLLYDHAMLGITTYSKVVMRLATLFGFGIACLCLILAAVIFFYKLFHWDTYLVGNAGIAVGVFFLGAMQLFFTGLLGEYIMSINQRVLHRPLVVEEKRLNYPKKAEEET